MCRDAHNILTASLLHVSSHCAGEYAQGEHFKLLQLHGLAHKDMPHPRCFLVCADQFVRHYEGKDFSNSMLEHSKMLMNMLQRNLASYQASVSPSEWKETSHSISMKPIFVRALAVPPYETKSGGPLISLKDSEDYRHYRMVASAVAITDPGVNTAQLRKDLSLPASPQAMHVVTHLLQTATTRNDQLHNHMRPPALLQHIQEDVEKAYAFLVAAVGQCLAAGERRELAKLTNRLAGAPWVMVQDMQKFVAPYDHVLDIDEDLEHGET